MILSTNNPEGKISQGFSATKGSEIVNSVEASHPENISVTVTVYSPAAKANEFCSTPLPSTTVTS